MKIGRRGRKRSHHYTRGPEEGNPRELGERLSVLTIQKRLRKRVGRSVTKGEPSQNIEGNTEVPKWASLKKKKGGDILALQGEKSPPGVRDRNRRRMAKRRSRERDPTRKEFKRGNSQVKNLEKEEKGKGVNVSGGGKTRLF